MNQRIDESANHESVIRSFAHSPFAHSLIPLPLHLVVIDELTDLTIQAGGPKSDLFLKLISAASIGRALGILFVLTTQSPRAEIVNGNLKAVMNTRIAFRTVSREDSRVIMDRADAADLPADRPGRMVVALDGKARVYQSYYLSDEALHAFQDVTQRPANLLTSDEQRVLRIALDELGGAFAIGEIYARTGPASAGGVSKRWLEHVAAAWATRGWLVRDSDPTHPRRVDMRVVGACQHLKGSLATPINGINRNNVTSGQRPGAYPELFAQHNSKSFDVAQCDGRVPKLLMQMRNYPLVFC